MTVDEAIATLEQARKRLGSDAELRMPDDLPVARVLVREGNVYVTDDPLGGELVEASNVWGINQEGSFYPMQ
jgi:hypothetical protein